MADDTPPVVRGVHAVLLEEVDGKDELGVGGLGQVERRDDELGAMAAGQPIWSSIATTAQGHSRGRDA